MARFEFDGDKYRQAATHQMEWGMGLLGGLALRGDERVLDLGCGDGALSARIAERVPAGEVIGIDASQGMIGAAKKFARENLHFSLKDIDELDGCGEFDLIFSNAALHWVEDHPRLLANCYRSLRAGGAIRFNFAGDGNCAHFFDVVRRVMAYPRFREGFAGFAWPWYMPSLAEYEGLLAVSEFAGGEVWGENRDRVFPDTEAMIRWIDQPSLVPFLGYVAERDRGAFRCNVVSEMVEVAMREDGSCFETFRRINVFARK